MATKEWKQRCLHFSESLFSWTTQLNHEWSYRSTEPCFTWAERPWYSYLTEEQKFSLCRSPSFCMELDRCLCEVALFYQHLDLFQEWQTHSVTYKEDMSILHPTELIFHVERLCRMTDQARDHAVGNLLGLANFLSIERNNLTMGRFIMCLKNAEEQPTIRTLPWRTQAILAAVRQAADRWLQFMELYDSVLQEVTAYLPDELLIKHSSMIDTQPWQTLIGSHEDTMEQDMLNMFKRELCNYLEGRSSTLVDWATAEVDNETSVATLQSQIASYFHTVRNQLEAPSPPPPVGVVPELLVPSPLLPPPPVPESVVLPVTTEPIVERPTEPLPPKKLQPPLDVFPSPPELPLSIPSDEGIESSAMAAVKRGRSGKVKTHDMWTRYDPRSGLAPTAVATDADEAKHAQKRQRREALRQDLALPPPPDPTELVPAHAMAFAPAQLLVTLNSRTYRPLVLNLCDNRLLARRHHTVGDLEYTDASVATECVLVIRRFQMFARRVREAWPAAAAVAAPTATTIAPAVAAPTDQELWISFLTDTKVQDKEPRRRLCVKCRAKHHPVRPQHMDKYVIPHRPDQPPTDASSATTEIKLPTKSQQRLVLQQKKRRNEWSDNTNDNEIDFDMLDNKYSTEEEPDAGNSKSRRLTEVDSHGELLAIRYQFDKKTVTEPIVDDEPEIAASKPFLPNHDLSHKSNGLGEGPTRLVYVSDDARQPILPATIQPEQERQRGVLFPATPLVATTDEKDATPSPRSLVSRLTSRTILLGGKLTRLPWKVTKIVGKTIKENQNTIVAGAALVAVGAAAVAAAGYVYKNGAIADMEKFKPNPRSNRRGPRASDWEARFDEIKKLFETPSPPPPPPPGGPSLSQASVTRTVTNPPPPLQPPLSSQLTPPPPAPLPSEWIQTRAMNQTSELQTIAQGGYYNSSSTPPPQVSVVRAYLPATQGNVLTWVPDNVPSHWFASTPSASLSSSSSSSIYVATAAVAATTATAAIEPWPVLDPHKWYTYAQPPPDALAAPLPDEQWNVLPQEPAVVAPPPPPRQSLVYPVELHAYTPDIVPPPPKQSFAALTNGRRSPLLPSSAIVPTLRQETFVTRLSQQTPGDLHPNPASTQPLRDVLHNMTRTNDTTFDDTSQQIQDAVDNCKWIAEHPAMSNVSLPTRLDEPLTPHQSTNILNVSRQLVGAGEIQNQPFESASATIGAVDHARKAIVNGASVLGVGALAKRVAELAVHGGVQAFMSVDGAMCMYQMASTLQHWWRRDSASKRYVQRRLQPVIDTVEDATAMAGVALPMGGVARFRRVSSRIRDFFVALTREGTLVASVCTALQQLVDRFIEYLYLLSDSSLLSGLAHVMTRGWYEFGTGGLIGCLFVGAGEVLFAAMSGRLGQRRIRWVFARMVLSFCIWFVTSNPVLAMPGEPTTQALLAFLLAAMNMAYDYAQRYVQERRERRVAAAPVPQPPVPAPAAAAVATAAEGEEEGVRQRLARQMDELEERYENMKLSNEMFADIQSHLRNWLGIQPILPVDPGESHWMTLGPTRMWAYERRLQDLVWNRTDSVYQMVRNVMGNNYDWIRSVLWNAKTWSRLTVASTVPLQPPVPVLPPPVLDDIGHVSRASRAFEVAYAATYATLRLDTIVFKDAAQLRESSGREAMEVVRNNRLLNIRSYATTHGLINPQFPSMNQRVLERYCSVFLQFLNTSLVPMVIMPMVDSVRTAKRGPTAAAAAAVDVRTIQFLSNPGQRRIEWSLLGYDNQEEAKQQIESRWGMLDRKQIMDKGRATVKAENVDELAEQLERLDVTHIDRETYDEGIARFVDRIIGPARFLVLHLIVVGKHRMSLGSRHKSTADHRFMGEESLLRQYQLAKKNRLCHDLIEFLDLFGHVSFLKPSTPVSIAPPVMVIETAIARTNARDPLYFSRRHPWVCVSPESPVLQRMYPPQREWTDAIHVTFRPISYEGQVEDVLLLPGRTLSNDMAQFMADRALTHYARSRQCLLHNEPTLPDAVYQPTFPVDPEGWARSGSPGVLLQPVAVPVTFDMYRSNRCEQFEPLRLLVAWPNEPPGTRIHLMGALTLVDVVRVIRRAEWYAQMDLLGKWRVGSSHRSDVDIRQLYEAYDRTHNDTSKKNSALVIPYAGEPFPSKEIFDRYLDDCAYRIHELTTNTTKDEEEKEDNKATAAAATTVQPLDTMLNWIMHELNVYRYRQVGYDLQETRYISDRATPPTTTTATTTTPSAPPACLLDLFAMYAQTVRSRPDQFNDWVRQVIEFLHMARFASITNESLHDPTHQETMAQPPQSMPSTTTTAMASVVLSEETKSGLGVSPHTYQQAWIVLQDNETWDTFVSEQVKRPQPLVQTVTGDELEMTIRPRFLSSLFHGSDNKQTRFSLAQSLPYLYAHQDMKVADFTLELYTYRTNDVLLQNIIVTGFVASDKPWVLDKAHVEQQMIAHVLSQRNKMPPVLAWEAAYWNVLNSETCCAIVHRALSTAHPNQSFHVLSWLVVHGTTLTR